ncbi:MAG: SRPBCC domain-containing protein [Brevefilum sp.]|nr:SRPBCC domain-containing protein [Brevefilum sp.]
MPDDTFFVYEKIIDAPIELIYRAFTSAAGFREWLCDVSSSNPTNGGWVYFAWNKGYFASGEFLKLVPNKAVSFTWIGKGEPGWSQVDMVIVPTDGEAYKVVLRHSGIGQSEEWAKARGQISKGWELGLENLKTTLEEGRNLRLMNRPLIGIFPYEYDIYADSEKKKLGYPVDYGVLVSNVVPNYGADKAGIHSDDLIVAINGHKVENIAGLFGVISEYAPGDQITIEAYRGSEHLTFIVDTTPQIVQALPGSPEELAKEIEANSTRLLETLDKVLSGVSDAEASYSPGEEKWSIKETLVHFILHERNLQTWINDLVYEPACSCEVSPGHCLFRIRATLTTYPTLNDLMAELRRSFKETVATVAFLEPSFTKRKASYWRLGYELLEKMLPYQEFVRHMEEMIKTARKVVNT